MLDCLFKYSDLQVTYGINIVAIADGQPKQMGILEILDKYIAYQRKVLTARDKIRYRAGAGKRAQVSGPYNRRREY